MSSGGKPRMLVVAPHLIEQTLAAGKEALLREYDLGGYFERVVHFHFHAPRARSIEIDPSFVIEEVPALGPKPLALPRYVVRGAEIGRRHGVSVVRATEPFWRGLVALGIARRLGLPFVVSLHTDYEVRARLSPEGTIPRVAGSAAPARSIARFVLSRADRVLPIRESLVPMARLYGARPERIRVFPHAVDFAGFPPPGGLPPAGLPAGRPLVSVAARLHRENFAYEILEIAAAVTAARPDVLFAIAGDGPERDGMRAWIEARGLADRVRLLGLLPRTDVLRLRAASSAALCLMGGFSLIEAAACGAPVVAYDVEWHAELVHPGETGALVAEGDRDGVVRALLRLLDDPVAARRMGEAAARLAREHHDVAVVHPLKRRIFDEILRCAG